MVCQEINEGLVGCLGISQHELLLVSPSRMGTGGRTFEQALDLGEFAGIVQLSKVLCFLRKILPLDCGVSLVSNDFRGCVVKVGDKRGEIEA